MNLSSVCFRATANDSRMATNKIITVAIITVLVLLIIAVIVSKFR
jgi:flagellar basal body-associated protein FliL